MLSSKGTSLSGQVLPSKNAQLTLAFIAGIWTGTIVHPKATIFAIAGPIVIGANCIIEEAAIIVNRCGRVPHGNVSAAALPSHHRWPVCYMQAQGGHANRR